MRYLISTLRRRLTVDSADVHKGQLLDKLGPWGPVIAFAVMFIVFTVLVGETFLTRANLLTVLNDQAILAIVTFGLTIVLLTGEFDLSIAGIFSISGALGAGLVSFGGLSIPMTIIVVLAVGAFIGLINGVLVASFHVPALVATIAVGSIVDGLSLWYTDGASSSRASPTASSNSGARGSSPSRRRRSTSSRYPSFSSSS